MNTDFRINLDDFTFSFGDIANGEISFLDTNIKTTTKANESPYGGSIEGIYRGKINAPLQIPITIPHTPPNADDIVIYLIGAGGTGGYVIRDLVRYIYALKSKGDTRNIKIKLIDGDDVEEKNLLRQNFLPRDLGKNKAIVQAQRYSAAFGLEIEAIPSMISNETPLEMEENYHLPIIVGCVDNHEARRLIRSKFEVYQSYWIDSGNERESGQVYCGYGCRNPLQRSGSEYRLPCITDIYPEILNPEKDPVDYSISCADRAMVESQSIFVNMLAANYVLCFIRKIIERENIKINGIEFNIDGITKASYLTEEYYRKIFY